MNGTTEATAATLRKLAAKELLQAIKENDYDAQTLEEIILIIDHEYLCCRLQESPALRTKFEMGISISMLGDFADHLSSCLVTFINPSSHFERQLQCRALLGVFAVLHLRGVTAQQTQSQAKWQNNLNGRFQDLVWLPEETSRFTANVFHKMQCSHLVSLWASFAQKFTKAEPKTTAGAAIAMDIMQLSVVVLTTALV